MCSTNIKGLKLQNVTCNSLNLTTNKLLCPVIYILMQSMRAINTFSIVISFSGERGRRIKQTSHSSPHQTSCLQHITKNRRYQMLSITCIMHLCQDPPAQDKYFLLLGHVLFCRRRGEDRPGSPCPWYFTTLLQKPRQSFWSWELLSMVL